MRRIRASPVTLPESLPAAEPTAVAGRPPLRILPLGDSITRGSYLALENGEPVGMPHPDGGGWRKGLQDRLRAAGIAFDFVGELDYLAYGRDGRVDPGFDPHHHGLAGSATPALSRAARCQHRPTCLPTAVSRRSLCGRSSRCSGARSPT